MTADLLPPWQRPDIIRQTQRLLHSFQHWTHRPLLPAIAEDPVQAAEQVFMAPVVLVSHGTQADPILNYGNQMALKLWDLDWERFTQMPSRLTAEPLERRDRERLLQQAREKGYIDNYEGVRITSRGQRFRITNVILWGVLDEQGTLQGQAATFTDWEML